MNKQISPDLIGTWHIYEMELWDEDYFNIEVQAYITVQEDGFGEFQFGLFLGGIDGKMVGQTFEFNWEGADRGRDKSGSGWIKLKNKNIIKGEFRIYRGDCSTFLAKRAE